MPQEPAWLTSVARDVRSAGSLERVEAWKAETNDRGWGVGSPDQRHARGSSVKRMREGRGEGGFRCPCGSTLTRPSAGLKPLDIPVVRDMMRRLSKWDVVLVDVDTILRATEIQESHRYSLRDSLIIASALLGGTRTILSEDLADGQTILGVTIKNPFR